MRREEVRLHPASASFRATPVSEAMQQHIDVCFYQTCEVVGLAIELGKGRPPQSSKEERRDTETHGMLRRDSPELALLDTARDNGRQQADAFLDHLEAI